MSDFTIAVLISGRGSNFIAIQQRIEEGSLPARIACVISSRADAPGLAYATERGIPTLVMPGKEQPEEKITTFLLEAFRKYDVALVVLAGFLRKIPRAVVEEWPDRIINIHPALLPSFGGKGMYGRRVHEAVLAYGCKVSGATVHLVSADYDTGPPVLQRCVPVYEDDTPETLAGRVLQVEHALLPEAVALFARGQVVVSGRTVRTGATKLTQS